MIQLIIKSALLKGIYEKYKFKIKLLKQLFFTNSVETDRERADMKKTFIKTRIITVFLILCMVLSLMPDLVLVEDFVTETADFTGSDKGKLAISCLIK